MTVKHERLHAVTMDERVRLVAWAIGELEGGAIDKLEEFHAGLLRQRNGFAMWLLLHGWAPAEVILVGPRDVGLTDGTLDYFTAPGGLVVPSDAELLVGYGSRRLVVRDCMRAAVLDLQRVAIGRQSRLLNAPKTGRGMTARDLWRVVSRAGDRLRVSGLTPRLVQASYFDALRRIEAGAAELEVEVDGPEQQDAET